MCGAGNSQGDRRYDIRWQRGGGNLKATGPGIEGGSWGDLMGGLHVIPTLT